MDSQIPPHEELIEIATSIYYLLRRYNTMDRQIIVSILSELVARELKP
jgi:hypothetical protein